MVCNLWEGVYTDGWELQSTKDANKFYNGKVEELGTNLKALERIIQEKTDGLRLIEDGLYHGFQA